MNFDDDDDRVIDRDNILNELNEIVNNDFSVDTPDLDETPYPLYMQQLLPSQVKQELVDHDKDERGHWDSQFEYLLSCIGYAVGLGNIYRFPSKVYNGGGGAFLIPYLLFCVVIGITMMMLEMSVGQFIGQGCTKAFHCVPLFFGLGWTFLITALLLLTTYSIVIAWCFLYLYYSFYSILPWSVCSNSFNTPICINSTGGTDPSINASFYEPSSIQYWNYFVTEQKRPNGTYLLITDPIGSPILGPALCLLITHALTSLIIMFGVKISGKVIYLTVIFPFIALLQFVILGLTLPGAAKGIKFFLYPNITRLKDPFVVLSALEQLLYSSGIATGGLITMASYNRFRDRIFRNVLIVIITDFITSFVSGFATFPVLGYMSHMSGREIKDLIPSDNSLFFITYPEAISSLSNSNLWSILFMLMAIFLGIDSLFVLNETVITGISDCFPIFYNKKNKIILTISIATFSYLIGLMMITPGGNNWMTLFDSQISPFVFTFSLIMEVLVFCWFYGFKRYSLDFELMTGKHLNFYMMSILYTIVPISVFAVMIFGAINMKLIVLHGTTFPQWTLSVAYIGITIVLLPLPTCAVYTLIRYRMKYPRLGIQEYLKMCVVPPSFWGPKLKRYWAQSDFYSKKLVKYKNDPKFLASMQKNENVEKLVYKSEKRVNSIKYNV